MSIPIEVTKVRTRSKTVVIENRSKYSNYIETERKGVINERTTNIISDRRRIHKIIGSEGLDIAFRLYHPRRIRARINFYVRQSDNTLLKAYDRRGRKFTWNN